MTRLGIPLPKRRSINPKETFNKGKMLKEATNFCINCGIPVKKGYKYCSNKCQVDYEYKQNVLN